MKDHEIEKMLRDAKKPEDEPMVKLVFGKGVAPGHDLGQALGVAFELPERDGILLTPPVACGLLPGVLRRTLLDSGRAVETVLRLEDLVQGPALYVGNALRGLLPVFLEC